MLRKNPKTKKDSILAEALAIIRHSILNDKRYSEQISANDFREFFTRSKNFINARNLPIDSASLNGIVIASPADLHTELMQLLGREQYSLMMAVNDEKINDDTKSIFNAALELGKRYTRYHPIILESNAIYLDSSTPLAKKFLQQSTYLNKVDGDGNRERHPKSTMILLVSKNETGCGFISSALQFLCEYGSNLRVSLFLREEEQGLGKTNTCGSFGEARSLIMQTLISRLHAMETFSEPRVKAIAAMFKLISTASGLRCVVESDNCDPQEFSRLDPTLQQEVQEIITQLQYSLTRCTSSFSNSVDFGHTLSAAFDIPSDVDVVILNGRIVHLRHPMEVEDFALLNQIEFSKVTQRLQSIFAESDISLTADNLIDAVSFCGRYSGSSSGRIDVQSVLADSDMSNAEYIFSIHPEKGDSSDDLSIFFVIDPMTVAGQRAVAVMRLIRDHLQLPFTLALVPLSQYESFPLQNFYRFVLSPGADAPSAVFEDLPRNHVLTVRPDVPESWNTQALIATQDIDNLRCDAVSCGDSGTKVSKVVYKLKNLLIAGQCFESTDRGRSMPPNGLQLVLSTNTSGGSSLSTDSMVMQNYGYFQFQASPGLW